MSADEIERVAGDEAQQYIFDHAHDDEKKLLLKHKTILSLPAALIAHQISGRRKAQFKLPLFYSTKGIVYPPTLNLEQCSSDATAKFKAQIVHKIFGDQKIMAADLTGGLGVDSYFLSATSSKLNYVEPNEELLNIARHNHNLLGAKTIAYHAETAEDFLNRENNFELIFIDPSRRDGKNKKIFLLSDCEPNLPNLLPKIFEKTQFVLIKTSPLLDIQQAINELAFVKKIFVVSVANECKELLFLLDKSFSGSPLTETVNLENNGSVKHYFQFSTIDERECVSDFASPQKYLYEPNASILKAGAFKLIGKKFNLKKLVVNTHLYTSTEFLANFPGRAFEILSLNFDPKSLSEKKANIISRNYPLTAPELKKKFKLEDGGENYLIAFSGQEKKYTVLAKRLA